MTQKWLDIILFQSEYTHNEGEQPRTKKTEDNGNGKDEVKQLHIYSERREAVHLLTGKQPIRGKKKDWIHVERRP